MTTDPVKLRQMAEAGVDGHYEFRVFLKHTTSLSSEEVDNLVFEIAERVWQRAGCTTCGNCCREVVPTFSEKDVERLAGRLGMVE